MKDLNPKSILIVRLSSIGDVVISTPVAKALRKAYPTATIVWVVENKSKAVVMGNPYLDDVIVWDRKSKENLLIALMRFFQIRKKLRKYKFDISIDLQGLFKSGMVSLASGAKRRIGSVESRDCPSFCYTDKTCVLDEEKDLSKRYLNFLRPLGIDSYDTQMCFPLSDDDISAAKSFFKENNLISDKTVILCVATTRKNKHWYNEGWAKLCDLLWDKYGITCVIIGSEANISMSEDIASKTKSRVVIAAGKTSIKVSGAMVKLSRATIGVDTGFLHIARALDVPAVGIFGATEWRFFPQTDKFVWAVNPHACSPCHKKMTCKNADCMRDVTPEYVVQKLEELLWI